MDHKIEGLEDLLKASSDLNEVAKRLDNFVSKNKASIPEEHKHLFDGISFKSLPELEELQKEINKLGA
jgi:hypothetical protein